MIRLRRRNSAFTLLETMVATAVAITVLGGGVAMSRSLASSKTKTEERAAAESLVSEGVEALLTYQKANERSRLGTLVGSGADTLNKAVPFFLYEYRNTPESATMKLAACSAPKATPPPLPPSWGVPQPIPTPGPEPCTTFTTFTGYGFISTACPGTPQKGECIGANYQSFLSHNLYDSTMQIPIAFRRFYTITKVSDLSYTVNVRVESATSDLVVQRTVVMSDWQ